MESITVPTEKLPKEPEEKPKGRRELHSTLAVLFLAPLLAFFLTIFVFQSYEVEGASMSTTLESRDRLIVNKTGRSWARITGNDYIPERYSIIVFNSHITDVHSQKKQLIKRIIGLPGDHVVIKDEIVTIFNDQNPQGFFPDRAGPQAGVIKSTDDRVDETVGEGEVFVMGDNRSNSLDSRTFGAIKAKDIVGVLSVRFLPLDSIQKF